MIRDISGNRYGKLTVKSQAERRLGRTAWNCVCDCGNAVTVLTGNLRDSGGTRSCGCYQKEQTSNANTLHGLSHSTEWQHWVRMLQRVSPHSPGAADYAERGITVSDELRNFSTFLSVMGRRPPGPIRWTVGRIDNRLGYERGNIEWQTYTAQARARRMPRTNTSGIFGVTIRRGKYIATWTNLEGALKSKSFSGPGAREAAIAFRSATVAEMNLSGANYHESNGEIYVKEN